ncbi:MAG: oligosaccharide flippase family protein [Rubellimicrobium sp.]|nr:oligosaccharide flippase family protein [Rubellimicrobium sp.]
MSTSAISTWAWSAVLQWARLGIGAAVFLIAARFLGLAEIGAFAVAFAPVRLAQMVHRAGIADATVVAGTDEARRSALFALSVLLGVLLTLGVLALAGWIGGETGRLMRALSPLPLVTGLSAPAEGLLRQALQIRALALRTLVAQGGAALLTLAALGLGWGAMALVLFAVVAAAVTGALSVAMAGWRPQVRPDAVAMRGEAAFVARLSMRELAAGAPAAVMQVAVAAVWGLPVAGAFQIATRMITLVDTLALAPLRYIALPRFSRGLPEARSAAIAETLGQAARLAFWLYPGAALSASEIAVLAVGPAHGGAVAPLFAALCLSGMVAALAMPLNQGLTAAGHAALTLRRTLWALVVSLGLALPLLPVSVLAGTMALALGGAVVLVPYAALAVPRLGLSRASVALAIGPAAIAGGAMAVVLWLAAEQFAGLGPALALGGKLALGSAVFAGGLALTSGLAGRRSLAPLA